MKTAVSIPEDVFEQVERLARRAKRSRSEVFSAALRECVARHAPDEITEAINAALEGGDASPDEFISQAARRVLEGTEWRWSVCRSRATWRWKTCQETSSSVITSLPKDSVANASQIVTIDKSLLGDRVGKLPRAKCELVLSAIDTVLGR